MGVVYEAREKSLDRIVALKVMRFGVVDPMALERFQREAETAGALHHTNIVPVYATGREGDTSWYAMQRIEGESLAHRIARAYPNGDGPIPIEEILRVGIQAAEALDHAHQRDVVHRDVKPANLIIDGDNRVWLTDFGLARRLVDVGATMTGAILGTPRYMSPEQADLRRTDVDLRTDIYSLGATLYEMATGRPPFEGDDPLTVIAQIRHDDPPSPGSLRPSLPRDLDVVLTKCMEKEAGRRYATAGELAEDLRAIRDDRAIRARPVSIFERTARWARKQHAGVRVASIAVLATTSMILLSIVGWQSWMEGKLGAFRLRAAGGPYVTTVHPASESSLSESAIQLTVPMQQHAKLPIGDYDMMLAPRGRWSQKLRLSVAGGMPTEFRLRNQPTQSKEISIEDAVAIPVAGYDEPAVLKAFEGQLQRITLSGRHEWTLDASRVEAVRTPLGKTTSSSEVAHLSINFADSVTLAETPRFRSMLDDNPPFSTPQLALPTPIDLDGDQAPDTIIAASSTSALLAVSANGNILWARAYDINGVSLDGNPSQPPQRSDALVFPGVLDCIDIGDRNEDGVHDLVVSMVHIRPGIQNDLCVAVLSGKDGEPISTIQVPPLKIADKTPWPINGVLHVKPKENSRENSRLGFGGSGTGPVYRSSSFNSSDNELAWSNGNRSRPTFAVPSPLQIVQGEDQLVAIYHMGDECRCYDLETGDQIGEAIKLPFVPATGPKLVRVGESLFAPRTERFVRGANNDNSATIALVFHERDHSLHPVPGANGNDRVTKLAAYSIDGKPWWEWLTKDISWPDFTGLRNKVDWPLAGDVDGDGSQELLAPIPFPRRYCGLQMLAGHDGAEAWSVEQAQVVRSADESLYRMTLSTDIDGDGWREWAVASIAGPRSHKASRFANTNAGEAYVYVDWISGKSGQPISWARHPIPIVSDAIAVAEIDAIRSDLPSSERGTVEVDFVTGDSQVETELQSMVLRFHPSSPDAIAVANGLDVVGERARGIRFQAGDNDEGSPATLTNASSTARIYRMRPGPYDDGQDRIVLLAEPNSQSLRLGEQEIMASWQEPDGRELIAVTGFDPKRLSVIDVASQRTLWATERVSNQSTFTGAISTYISIKVGQQVQFSNVNYTDGSVDFLVQERGQEELSLVDGSNGRPIWTKANANLGLVKSAKLVDDDKWIWLICDGSGRGGSLNEFVMSIIHAKTGTARWSRHFLYNASRLNTPSAIDDYRFVDINRDGISDVIGPDQDGGQDELLLGAWDGASGERLWSHRLHQRGSATSYFVPFCIIDEGDRQLVAYIGASGAQPANQTSFSLFVCDAATGDELATRPLTETRAFRYVRRGREHQQLAIAGWNSADKTFVGLMTSLDQQVGNRWLLLQLSDGELLELTNSDNSMNLRRADGMWLRNVAGDSLPERLQTNQLSSVQGRSDDGTTYRHGQRTSLSCTSTESEEPLWTVTVPDYWKEIYWEDADRFSAAWMELDAGQYALIDLAEGELIDVVGNSRSGLPRVTAVENQTHGKAFRIALPTKDGVRSVWLGAPQDTTPLVAKHSALDPRRVQQMMAVGPATAAQMLADGLRSLAAVVTLLLIPIGYFGTMIRRRQWSLSWMFLAPPVVLMVLIVWNARWVHEPSLMANLVSGIAWLSGVSALYFVATQRSKGDPFYGKAWIFLAILTVVMFGLLVWFQSFQANEPGIRYVVHWPDVLKMFISTVCMAGQIYWLTRGVVALVKRVRRRVTRKEAP